MLKPVFVFLFALMTLSLNGQDTAVKKLDLNGYVSLMESATKANFQGNDLLWEFQCLNRLNINWYFAKEWTAVLQGRNRLLLGDPVKRGGQAHLDILSEDQGLTDMNWNLGSGNSWLLNTSVDRCYLNYSRGKFQVTAGRQRINWGQTYVWNPNDWFNNYSFFDVEYIERPGSDALRLQYFTGVLSHIEAVVKTDRSHKITLAGLFKTNLKGYDLQLIGGLLAKNDLGIGMGWSGKLGQIGFIGEMTYLHPAAHSSDSSGLFLMSVAFDYTFSNSLTLQAEGFYNQHGDRQVESFTEYFSRNLTVKDLSFTTWSFCLQASYPINTLWNTSFAAMYFPDAGGYYLGPSVTCSVARNVEAALFFQHFNGKSPYPVIAKREKYTLGFLRVRFSF
jgi:hypothetical protein